MNDKIKNIITCFSFVIFILVIFIINLFKKDELISLTERRKLEQFPSISFKGILDGSFFDKFDKYTTDQFVLRDDLRGLKVNLELLVKNNYNNLFLKDGYIIESLYPFDKGSVDNISNKINFIKNNYLKDNKVYFSIIPDKNYFVDDSLKLDYDLLESMMVNNLNGINYIDIFDNLSLDNYYKTDTHWKSETLKDVVSVFSEKMNFKFNDNFEEEVLTDFNGIYSGRLPIGLIGDEIKILKNDFIIKASVYNYESNLNESVYNLDKINSNDKYDIYLSGPVSLLEIKGNKNSKKELIVFRDSYGSSIIPLFIEGYKKITVVDTRYISPRMLGDYIDFNNQDVLFLYSTLLINNSYSLK